MPTDVTLTSALRNYLQSMQNTKRSETAPNAASPDAAGEASACESINKAAQDFCTQTLSAHATELTARMEEISSSIKSLEQDSRQVSELLSLITNAELAALAAQSALDADEAADITKFDQSLQNVLENAQALLENSDLFPEGLGLDKVSLTSPATVAAAVTIIRDAVDEAQGVRTTIISDLNAIQAEQDFTKGTIQALETGKEDLNITSLSEEGANLLALQTKMDLSGMSLSLASPSQEEVLRLF